MDEVKTKGDLFSIPIQYVDLDLKVMAYYWMGKSYQGMQEYKKGIFCFKKML